MSLFGANPFCRCSCLRHQICAWYDFQSYGMASGTRLKLSIPADKCAQWPWRKVRPTRTCSHMFGIRFLFIIATSMKPVLLYVRLYQIYWKNVSSYVHAVAHSGMGQNSITKALTSSTTTINTRTAQRDASILLCRGVLQSFLKMAVFYTCNYMVKWV